MEVRRSGKTTRTVLEALTALLEGNNVCVVYFCDAMARDRCREASEALRGLIGCQFGGTSNSISFRPSVVLDRKNKYRLDPLRYIAEEEFTLKFVSKNQYKNEHFNGWVTLYDHYQD
jgi:hypothetical protein